MARVDLPLGNDDLRKPVHGAAAATRAGVVQIASVRGELHALKSDGSIWFLNRQGLWARVPTPED